jgi:hypothetical protein
MFYKTSRYTAVKDCRCSVEGRSVQYKAIRIIPVIRPGSVHTVQEGDRIDQIAFTYLRDPERYWKICDLNNTMWPPDLTAKPGMVISIPYPEV